MTAGATGAIMGSTLHIRATLPMRKGMTETYAYATPTGATAVLLERSPMVRRQRGSLRGALVASSIGADEGPQAPREGDVARARRVQDETVPAQFSA